MASRAPNPKKQRSRPPNPKPKYVPKSSSQSGARGNAHNDEEARQILDALCGDNNSAPQPVQPVQPVQHAEHAEPQQPVRHVQSLQQMQQMMHMDIVQQMHRPVQQHVQPMHQHVQQHVQQRQHVRPTQPVQHVQSRGFVSQKELTQRLNAIRKTLHATNVYVDPEMLVKQLNELSEIPSHVVKSNEMYKELSYRHKEISTAIRCYFVENSVWTVRALERFVLDELQDKAKRGQKAAGEEAKQAAAPQLSGFHDLMMGALTAHPAVIEKFQLYACVGRPVDEFPAFTPEDVVKYVGDYTRQQKLKFDATFEEFQQWMLRKHRVQSFGELGIGLQFNSVKQKLIRASRDEMQLFRKHRSAKLNQIEADAEHWLENALKQLAETSLMQLVDNSMSSAQIHNWRSAEGRLRAVLAKHGMHRSLPELTALVISPIVDNPGVENQQILRRLQALMICALGLVILCANFKAQTFADRTLAANMREEAAVSFDFRLPTLHPVFRDTSDDDIEVLRPFLVSCLNVAKMASTGDDIALRLSALEKHMFKLLGYNQTKSPSIQELQPHLLRKFTLQRQKLSAMAMAAVIFVRYATYCSPSQVQSSSALLQLLEPQIQEAISTTEQVDASAPPGQQFLETLCDIERGTLEDARVGYFEDFGSGSLLQVLKSPDAAALVASISNHLKLAAGDVANSQQQVEYHDDRAELMTEQAPQVDCHMLNGLLTQGINIANDGNSTVMEILAATERYVCDSLELVSFEDAGHGPFNLYVLHTEEVAERLQQHLPKGGHAPEESRSSEQQRQTLRLLMSVARLSYPTATEEQIASFVAAVGGIDSNQEVMLSGTRVNEASRLCIPAVPGVAAVDLLSCKDADRIVALKAVLWTPWLCSVQHQTNFDAFFREPLQQTLLEFLASVTDDDLQAAGVGETQSAPLWLVVNKDDAVALPSSRPTAANFVEMIKANAVQKIAAHLLSATVGQVLNQPEGDRAAIFQQFQIACQQRYAELTSDDGQTLVSLSVQVLLQLPVCAGLAVVFERLLDAVATAVQIDCEHACRLLIRFVRGHSLQSAINSRLLKIVQFNVRTQSMIAELLKSTLATTEQETQQTESRAQSKPRKLTATPVCVEPTTVARSSPADALQSDATQSVDVSGDCFGVVTNIRATKFNIDESGEMQENPMQAMMNRALSKISAELYSKKVHFVLELVQNADDNLYPPGALPSLKVILTRDAVLFRNNEVGFSEENIRALCDVGSSTKQGGKGFIGQKGIGFKSVFSVTTRPEIHSNGFHVAFDRDNCMIIPIWIADEQSWPVEYDPNDEESWNTSIKLPLDQQATREYVQLESNLRTACDANILLFLNKLERIIVEVPETTDAHVRFDLQKRLLGDGWVETSQNSASTIWYIRSQTFAPASQRDRMDVEITEVAIACHFTYAHDDDHDGNGADELDKDRDDEGLM